MPLEPPAAIAAADITFRLGNTQSRTRSPFTRTSQGFDWGREMWSAEVRFARRQRAAAGQMRGFLAGLRGRGETFWLGDPAAAVPQGTQTADFVLAAEAAAGDRSLAVTMDAGATLLSGDYVQLGDRLHLVTTGVAADGAGAATLSVWPAVRETQSVGAAVKSSNARGLWRAAVSTLSYNVRPAGFYSTAFEIEEAI